MPSDMRSVFLELLASSVAGECRDVTTSLIKLKSEGEERLTKALAEAYLEALQQLIEKYEAVFKDRVRRHQVTQLEKGFRVMCDKQLKGVEKYIPLPSIQAEENESCVSEGFSDTSSVHENNAENEVEDTDAATSEIVVDSKFKRRVTGFRQVVSNFFASAKTPKVYSEKERTSPDATVFSCSTASPASVSSLGIYAAQVRHSPVPMISSADQFRSDFS